ncbi:MAG: hypothetical protein ACO33A_00485 [Hyphomonas sp.]
MAVFPTVWPALAQSLEDGLSEAWRSAGKPADLVMPPPVGVWEVEGSAIQARSYEARVPGGEALRLDIRSRTPNPWDAFAAAYTTTDIRAGDLIFVSLWARSANPPRGMEAGVLPNVLLQERGGNYADFGSWTVTLDDEWRSYVFQAVAPRDFRAGELGVVIHLGRYRQKIDLGPVYALNLGPDTDLDVIPAPPAG